MKLKDWDKVLPFIYKEVVFFNKQLPRILYDHIPKCAGTRVFKHLKYSYPERKVYWIQKPYLEDINRLKNLPQETINQKLVYSGHEGHLLKNVVSQDSKIIVTLREPISRIISYYYFIMKFEQHEWKDEIVKNNFNLGNFFQLNPKEFSNYYVKHFTKLTNEQIDENPEQAVELALENLLKYDLVGFDDSLDCFFDVLKNKLNIKSYYPRAKENKNAKKSKVIEDEILQSLKKQNSLDIEFYKKLLTLRSNGVIDNLPVPEA